MDFITGKRLENSGLFCHNIMRVGLFQMKIARTGRTAGETGDGMNFHGKDIKIFSANSNRMLAGQKLILPSKE